MCEMDTDQTPMEWLDWDDEEEVIWEEWKI